MEIVGGLGGEVGAVEGLDDGRFNPNAEDVRLVPRLAVSMQLRAKSRELGD